MSAGPADLSPLIAATTRWLTRAYAAPGGPLGAELAAAQTRQAVTVAAWLRYPTDLDAALVLGLGPGGSARLDWLVGADCAAPDEAGDAWRTWVDEVVASWAACLLGDPALAGAAVTGALAAEHAGGLPLEFRRLTAPDDSDRRAAALLRHPDLVAPVAALHRDALLERLGPPAPPAAGDHARAA
ncbi:hypothetical protein GCM10010218_52850 [Streptomyces mashuensis]|uniref:Uncharacterized protein n=1 Tax=Streptomyces mashuensis TaxID=33904 RepID=A0A919EFP3_9ACTN|nr:hypothetical protein [Streptomyces mashuensis]GHF64824.1 hypothetical protein GCM10010218_52850 [Streptomyces mashuensis]